MNLALNQLVYTSFADVGFKLLTSGQVPLQIQHTFLKQVVYRHWNAYEPKSPSYRAAYLLQPAPDHWLFGWLYNNKLDEVSCSYIPYFICYYLAEPLHAFRIEKVCACLQKGPVALLDLYSFLVPLEPLILTDLSSYQGVRPGVVIPWEVREQIYMALKQGKLTDIFIPVNEQERVIELPTQVRPQELVAKDKSADNFLLPFIPINEQERVIELPTQVQPQELVAKDESAPDNFLLPFIPDNEQETITELRSQVQPQELVAKDKVSADNSLLLYGNSILLFGMGLGATTILAVAGLIYVFINITIVAPNQPTQSPSQNTSPQTDPSNARISPKP